MATPRIGAAAVRSFFGRGASGNVHQVILPAADDWTAQRAAALSVRIAPVIVVLIRQLRAADTPCYRLGFFCNGVAIMRCGSGSLAAARALIAVGVARTPLNFVTPGGAVQIVSGGADVLGYSIIPLRRVRADNVRRWQHIIDRKLCNVVLIGSDRDYCLLELPDELAVARCRINAKRLSLASTRAVIVTARSQKPGHDYVLRYFSPQYGQHEDGATGSAHAMAAAYWQDRFSKPRLRGLQRSAGGGDFTVQRSGLAQCVFGQVEICATSEYPPGDGAGM